MTEWGGGSIPKVACPECGKRCKGNAGVRSHMKMKHPKKSRKAFAPEPAEESFADRAIQAEIDRACGIPNDDIGWLLP